MEVGGKYRLLMELGKAIKTQQQWDPSIFASVAILLHLFIKLKKNTTQPIERIVSLISQTKLPLRHTVKRKYHANDLMAAS